MTAGFGPAWIARVHAALLRPVPLADDERADALATVTAVCEKAQASAGWTGLLRMALLEWIDAARQSVRATLGRPQSTGQPSSRAPGPGRSPRGHLPGRLALDVRLAWRGFRVNRSGVALAVATLALGIGLGTSVFSVLDAMLWRPVPFAEADRLAQLVLTDVRSKVTFNGQMSDSMLLGWRDEHDLFDRVEGLDTPSFVYANDAGAEMIAGASVTPGLLGLLGVSPHIGRVFVEGDGREGSADIAVVSDAFWRRRLQGDPGVLDRRIRLDGDDYRIVGVMPAAFRYPNADVEVWVPVDPAARPASSTLRVGSPLVRIAPGRTRDAVAAEVRARGERVNVEHGGSSGVSASLWSIDRGVQDATRRSFWLLAAAAGFLVLIVCANAANLSLARSIGRARDLAVRSALGASRTDVIRSAVVEQAMIATAGCAGGIALAFGLVRIAMALLPDAMTASTLHAFAVDGRAIGCAVALAMIAAVMSALPAALVASRPSMAGLMADRTRGGSSSSAARRARTALVVVEVALSIVLVVGAALMTRSFLRLAAAETGFDPRGLVYVRVGLPAPAYADAAVRDAFTTDVVDRLRKLPSVTAATTGDLPSERQAIAVGRMESADRPGEQSPRLIVPMHEVPPNYFDSIRLPLLEGRTVALHGPAGESVVVNRAFAAKFFPGDHAVGSKFRLETGPWQTIVGVAEDARPMSAAQGGQAMASYAFYYGPGQAPNPLRAIAARSAMAEFRTLMVRSDQPMLSAPAISRIVHAADPRVVVWKTAMVEHLYADAIAVPRAMVAIMSVFGAAALVLAAAGLYGVLAYLVAQREREMGIRVALGASASQVGSLVLRSGLSVTLAGIVIGIGLAAMLTQTMRSLLFETGPADVLSMAGSAAVTMACALVACWRPARRAMTADPANLFRAD